MRSSIFAVLLMMCACQQTESEDSSSTQNDLPSDVDTEEETDPDSGNNTDTADRARQLLLDENSIRVVYDDPWFWKCYLNKGKKQMEVLINKVKTQMKELFETFSTYFSHEAPVKVKTVKDGTRAHEFHED